MQKKWTNTILQSCLVTSIAVNLMLIAMLIWSKFVPISAAIPSIATASQLKQSTEYIMELQDRKQKGNYQVEHYQEIEVTKDKQGNIIKKTPASEETYLRYWNGSNKDE